MLQIEATQREISARNLCDIGYDGYAIGGLAVGEGQESMFATVAWTTPFLPEDRPRYLMGVAAPGRLLRPKGGVEHA